LSSLAGLATNHPRTERALGRLLLGGQDTIQPSFRSPSLRPHSDRRHPDVRLRRVPDGRRHAASLDPLLSEESSARGAASCRAVLGSCPVAAAVRAAAQVPSPRSRRGWPSAPSRRDPGRGRAAQGVSPVARMSGRRPGRSLPCPPRPVRRGDVRPTGRADVQHPRVRCPRVRCPGVRGIRVSGRTRSGVRGAVAALSARWTRSGSVWRAAPAGRSGSTCRRGPRAAWSPACIGPDGKGMVRRWPWLARTRVDVAQGRRLAGVPAAAPPWPQRPTRALVQGQDAGRVAGEHGTEQVLTGPAGRPGQVAGVVLTNGPGPRGGDHAAWSLGEGGPVASSSGGPTRFGGGAACGRGAAAARKERCPLGADRSLTSENSGGRDRV
jgi:hypothetical protein